MLLATAVALALFGVAGAGVQNRLSAAAYEPESSSQSIAARDKLSGALGYWSDPIMAITARAPGPISGRSARRDVRRLTAELSDRPGVGHVDSFLSTRNRALLSNDRRATVILVFLRHPISHDDTSEVWKPLARNLPRGSLEVTIGGWGPATGQTTDQARRDLVTAELISGPILLLLLIFVFRGLVAAAVPLIAGLVGMLGTFAILGVLNELTTVSIFALNVATALGLGLTIDYSLLMVSRFREELAEGASPSEAVVTTIRTAGRTVMFSGLTVMAALGSLLIFPERLVRSLGYGGTLVCLFSVLTALVVVPPLLAILGHRINSLSLRRRRVVATHKGHLYGFAMRLMRRPLTITLVTSGALIAIGIPALRANFVGASPESLSASTGPARVAKQLSDDFPLGTDGPVRVVTPRGMTTRQLVRLRDQIGHLNGVTVVTPPRRLTSAGIGEIDVGYVGTRYQKEAQGIVRQIRSLAPPGVLVAGTTAQFVDYEGGIRDRLPVALLIIAIAMLVCVFGMTGSAILPLKMLLTSVVTICASFGLLVLVFQDGNLQSLLDFSSEGGLDTGICVLILAAAFGLTTDYGMFLIARIREYHEAGLSNQESIARGLQQTGRTITGAAALLCVALGAMATSGLVLLKQAGLGISLAIAIDATIVRIVLVPALMGLLGNLNWWCPAPLRQLHRRLWGTGGVAPEFSGK